MHSDISGIHKTEDSPSMDEPLVNFRSLQYALFITIFVEVVGALFFFLTALYIEKDKSLVDLTLAGKKEAPPEKPENTIFSITL